MDNLFTPKYVVIKESIKEKIINGSIGPHDRVPSETELSKEFDVSIITSRRALTDLFNEGFIYRVQGKGSFVSDLNNSRENRNTNTRLVALVLSLAKYYEDIFLDIIKGAQSYFETRDYSMIFHYYESDSTKERKIVESLINKNIEGLMLYSYDPTENIEMIKALRQRKFPFVLIDRHVADVPTNYVISDGFDGAYEAVEFLINLGHRKIAFVSNDVDFSSVKDRNHGYKMALSNNCIPFNSELEIFQYNQRTQDVMDLLLKKKATAIFAVNDLIAINIMDEARKIGLETPKDFSIVGFDDISSASSQRVPLTTVQQPFYEIGQTAAEILIKNVEDRNVGCQKVILPNKLIIRDSSSAINIDC